MVWLGLGTKSFQCPVKNTRLQLVLKTRHKYPALLPQARLQTTQTFCEKCHLFPRTWQEHVPTSRHKISTNTAANVQFRFHKLCCKISRHLVKNIQWFHMYKC